MKIEEKGNLWLCLYGVGVSYPFARPNLCSLVGGGIYEILLMLLTPIAAIVKTKMGRYRLKINWK